jgi:predicted pyridoxine 5'-phosphate oxidase superfamily flavin-nucleotide-binding protein
MARNYLATHLTPAVLTEQTRYYGQAQTPPASAGPDALGAMEAGFIAERDSFYIASVTEDGAPYLQHRGGPPGFLRVLDARTLAFADFGGNRQMLTVGHLQRDDRVALFLMDYPGRLRLKIDGRARVTPAADDSGLAASLAPPGAAARAVERIFRVDVTAFDWNCPKYITPRYTAAEIEEAAAPLRARIAELEARLRSQT